MPSAGFEPANPATEQLQTYALERTATGIGTFHGVELSKGFENLQSGIESHRLNTKLM
jgi:hypothetical protein